MRTKHKLFFYLCQIPLCIQAQESATSNANVPTLVLPSPAVAPSPISSIRIEEVICKMDKDRLIADNAKLTEDLAKANQLIEKLRQENYVSMTNFNNQHIDLEVTKTKLSFCESNKTLQLVFGSVSTVGSIVAGAVCAVKNSNTENP